VWATCDWHSTHYTSMMTPFDKLTETSKVFPASYSVIFRLIVSYKVCVDSWKRVTVHPYHFAIITYKKATDSSKSLQKMTIFLYGTKWQNGGKQVGLKGEESYSTCIATCHRQNKKIGPKNTLSCFITPLPLPKATHEGRLIQSKDGA
jgi:hypothetical protein